MAAASLAAGDHAHRRQWRYTWETLAHLPLLRLYLFRPSATALRPTPSGLRADLRLDASLLLLSFSLAGDSVLLRVPVPRVLVDPSAPPECRAAGDHLEVRLTLVLPVDHPVVAAAFPGAHPPTPLALRDDLKSLSSEDVHLYCKTCSTRLTRQPLRDIVEMPSLDWEDVADNWFGGCCTSFGGASEKLVSRYINAYGRLEGTTLLDATSIIIEKDYLEMGLVSTVANSVPDIDFVALQEAMSTVSLQNDCTTEKIKLNKPEDEACHRNKIGSSHVQAPRVLEEGPCVNNTENNGRTPWTDQSGTIQLKIGGDVNFEKSKGDCFVENVKQPSLETDSSPVDPCSCCCDSGDSGKAEYNTSKMPSNNWKVQTALENQRDYKLTKMFTCSIRWTGTAIQVLHFLRHFCWGPS